MSRQLACLPITIAIRDICRHATKQLVLSTSLNDDDLIETLCQTFRSSLKGEKIVFVGDYERERNRRDLPSTVVRLFPSKLDFSTDELDRNDIIYVRNGGKLLLMW